MIETILTYLAPALTGVVGWLAGNRKRKNDFLTDLQASIDLLAEKNKQLLSELVTLRGENAELLANQVLMQSQIVELHSENGKLREEIEQLNTMLANVKTITKKL